MYSQEAALRALRTPLRGMGKTFYVDAANGSDNHHGRTPKEAFQSITAAIAACTSGNQDIIYVINYPYGSSVEASFPIVINKDALHLIGCGAPSVHPAMSDDWSSIDGGGNTVIQLGANLASVEIAGLSLFSEGAACIDLAAATWMMHIHHMTFGELGAAQDGIFVGGEGPEYALAELCAATIEHCLFGMRLTRDGIRTGVEYGSLTFSWIMHNIFKKYGGVGINFQQHNPAAQGGGFIGNRFFKEIAAAAGWAITIGGGVAGEAAINTMIDDNRAMESGVAPQNNPYLDTSTGVAGTTKNAWGVNWSGGVTVMPDVA